LGRRPAHLRGKRATKPVDVGLEGAWDPDTGMQWCKKKFLYPEIFRLRFDPDAIAKSPPLPVGVECVFNDVFGELAKNGKLKIALHPWFKRWCLFEFVFDPQIGQPGWHCAQIFHDFDTQKDGYLPADLNYEDKRAEELRGRLGDYVPPNRRDLEWVKAHCDKQRVSPEEMYKFVLSRREDARRASECEDEAFLHDFHSHHFNLIRDMANIEEGCASKSMQCNQTSHDELDRRKWERERSHIIEFEGTKHRVKKGSRHEQWLFDKMAAKKQAAEEEHKKLIEHTYIVEQQLDKRAMLREANRLSLGMSDAKSGHNGKTM